MINALQLINQSHRHKNSPIMFIWQDVLSFLRFRLSPDPAKFLPTAFEQRSNVLQEFLRGLVTNFIRSIFQLANKYINKANKKNLIVDLKSLFLTLLLLFFSPVLFASPAQNIYNFNTVEQQNRFDELTQNLRCLVCQNQTLAESNAPLAQDLRAQIFQMIQNKKSNQDIKNYLIHRYGNFVSYTPPFNPSTYLLWGLPGILLLIGIFIIRRLSS